jgi:hypothetical protein
VVLNKGKSLIILFIRKKIMSISRNSRQKRRATGGRMPVH